MSTQVNKFMGRGAELVAGDLILNRKSMGRFRDGVFYVSADGLDELDVEEVKVKPTAAEKAEIAKSEALAATEIAREEKATAAKQAKIDKDRRDGLDPKLNKLKAEDDKGLPKKDGKVIEPTPAQKIDEEDDFLS